MFEKMQLDLPEGQYEIGKVVDDVDKLSVEILLDDQSLELFFEEKVLLRLMNESVATYNLMEGCDPNWPLYIAEKDTEFLNFFFDQTGEVYRDWGYKHVRIFGQEEIVDVITTDAPKLK